MPVAAWDLWPNYHQTICHTEFGRILVLRQEIQNKKWASLDNKDPRFFITRAIAVRIVMRCARWRQPLPSEDNQKVRQRSLGAMHWLWNYRF